MVSPRLARKIGTLRCRTKVNISPADGGPIKGSTHVVNTSFKFLSQENYTDINDLLEFNFDTEVLDLCQRDMIIGLS